MVLFEVIRLMNGIDRDFRFLKNWHWIQFEIMSAVHFRSLIRRSLPGRYTPAGSGSLGGVNDPSEAVLFLDFLTKCRDGLVFDIYRQGSSDRHWITTLDRISEVDMSIYYAAGHDEEGIGELLANPSLVPKGYRRSSQSIYVSASDRGEAKVRIEPWGWCSYEIIQPLNSYGFWLDIESSLQHIETRLTLVRTSGSRFVILPKKQVDHIWRFEIVGLDSGDVRYLVLCVLNYASVAAELKIRWDSSALAEAEVSEAGS